MPPVPSPADETGRLAALHALRVLDTAPEAAFDALVRMAAEAAGLEVALLSLVDRDRQWAKAAHNTDLKQTPRDDAFCAYTILGPEPMAVEDAARDPRFAQNPLVLGAPRIRSYLGIPLVGTGGHAYGALCAIGTEPCRFSADIVARLRDIGLIATRLLEARAHAAEATELSASLAKTNRHFEQVSEVSGVGGWELDLTTNALSWSTQTRAIHQIGAEEAPTLDTALAYYPPESRPVVAAAVQASVETGADWDLELPFITARGHRRWVRAVGRCDRSEPDRPRLYGAFQDITPRREAEDALRAAHTQLATFFDVGLDLLCISDAEGRFVRVNHAWESVLGMPVAALVGRRYIDFVHPEDVPATIAAAARFAEGDSLRNFVNRYRNADGSYRHIEWSTVRSDGAFYSAARDITARIEQTAALERARVLAETRAEQLELARRHIEHTALHDPLTGLPNRRYLDDTLRRAAQKTVQDGGGIGLLHIDLDRFKQINDTLGHAAGDFVLTHAAAILLANRRPQDFVARVGGDEFVLLAPFESDPKVLSTIAQRLIKALQEPAVFQGQPCRVGASIGIACAIGTVIDPAALLVNADIALYRAKAAGRGRFEFFSDAIQAELQWRKRTADDIHSGLDRDEFLPHYQPQVRAGTLEVVGAEALVRWHHPQKGIQMPDRFLGVADDLGMIDRIDRAVLIRALEDLRRWDAIGLAVPRVSVNVSARRLNDWGLIEHLSGLDIPPGRLAFELVEAIFLDDAEDVAKWNIDFIKEMGIDIEIDDFGTGHASIVSLVKLSPQRLKIDRHFTQPICDSARARKLVAQIIDIGKSLGIAVIAEGVETEAHARILHDLGCDALQGMLFAPALPPDAFEQFVRLQGEKASRLRG